jgi:hypothetical protein
MNKLLKGISLNERGDDEASESFRLLIAFALAAAVLVIIIVMVGRVNNQSILISTAKFEEGVVSASKGPGITTETPFIIEDVMLSGIISKERISSLTSYPKKCILFITGPGFDNSSPNFISVNKKFIKTDVYVYCGYNGDPGAIALSIPSDCPTYCGIYFNKRPDSSLYPATD